MTRTRAAVGIAKVDPRSAGHRREREARARRDTTRSAERRGGSCVTEKSPFPGVAGDAALWCDAKKVRQTMRGAFAPLAVST